MNDYVHSKLERTSLKSVNVRSGKGILQVPIFRAACRIPDMWGGYVVGSITIMLKQILDSKLPEFRSLEAF